MKNSKLRRALLLVASAVLLVCVSVGATLAYLVDDDAVTNTFTVGKIYIELDETDSAPLNQNPNSGANHENRDKKNDYHILPAAEFVKDPIVWVQDGSEKAYLFLEVDNQIYGIEASTADQPSSHTQICNNGWTHLTSEDTLDDAGNIIATKCLYYRVFDCKNPGDITKNTDWEIPTFEKIWIASNLNSEAIAPYANKTITVKAYAIQYDGFKDDDNGQAYENAWDALKTQLANQQ